MSTALPYFDLNGIGVGSGGSIDLSSVMGGGGIATVPGAKLPTVRLHNDSGCGLQITLPNSGQSFNLPAGGWQDCQPSAGETRINFTVLYILPDPPVTLLMSTYFGPGEAVPAMTVLGNSPVGVGGTVNTTSSGANTVINTTSTPGTTWLNIQPSDAAGNTFLADNSGNLIVKSDNAGTLKTLLQLIAGASPQVLLAAAGILTTILDGLTVQGNLIVGGSSTLDNGDITTDGTGNFFVNGTMSVNGTSSLDTAKITTDGNGNITNFGGNLMLNGSNPILSVSAGNTRVQCASGGTINFQVPGGTTVAFINSTGLKINTGKLNLVGGSISRTASFSGSASGTYTHGMGAVPNIIIVQTGAVGSQTTGYDTATTTQTHVTLGAALAFQALCIAY